MSADPVGEVLAILKQTLAASREAAEAGKRVAEVPSALAKLETRLSGVEAKLAGLAAKADVMGTAAANVKDAAEAARQATDAALQTVVLRKPERRWLVALLVAATLLLGALIGTNVAIHTLGSSLMQTKLGCEALGGSFYDSTKERGLIGCGFQTTVPNAADKPD